MRISHMHAWCLWRPDETGSPETGAKLWMVESILVCDNQARVSKSS